MELLLKAAAALGLLEKYQERFSNTPLTETCLTPGAPGGLVRSLRLEAAFYHRWGHLAEAVLTGKRPEENRRDVTLHEDHTRFKKHGAAHNMAISNNIVLAIIAKANYHLVPPVRRFFAAQPDKALSLLF